MKLIIDIPDPNLFYARDMPKYGQQVEIAIVKRPRHTGMVCDGYKSDGRTSRPVVATFTAARVTRV